MMAEKKNVHTVPTEDGWANRREGGERASSTHDTPRQRHRPLAVQRPRRMVSSTSFTRRMARSVTVTRTGTSPTPPEGLTERASVDHPRGSERVIGQVRLSRGVTGWGSATGDGVPYGVARLLTNYGRMKHDEGGACRERQPSAMAGGC